MAHWIEKAQKQIAKLTPKTGFNVVAVDSYEKPGRALYLVDHFDDEKEAEKARAAHEKKSGDKAYVYAARAAETKPETKPKAKDKK